MTLDADLQACRDKLIQTAGELSASLGLNRTVGMLYGCLFFSREPMSLEALAEAASMSKANASIYVRYLETWRAVRRVNVPGDRRDYYEADRDIMRIVTQRLQEGVGKRLDALGGALDEAASRLDGPRSDADPQRAFMRERLAEVRSYEARLRRLLRNSGRVYSLLRKFL